VSFDPHKRDASWQMIQPGCYVDPAGCAHLFPDEVLAELQRQFPEAGFDACSREDYELIVKLYVQEFSRCHPGLEVRFAKHEREAAS
jgi:hypothetical protein